MRTLFITIVFIPFFFFSHTFEQIEAKFCPIGQFPLLISTDPVETDCKPTTTGMSGEDTPSGEDNSDEMTNNIRGYLLTFLKVFMGVGTALSAVMIMYSGYSYIISAGDARKLEEAKVMLFRAGIGILVLSCSFAMMNLLNVAADLG